MNKLYIINLEKEKGWGGARKGAGRPVGPEGRRVLLAARVAPSTFASLERLALDAGGLGLALDRLVKLDAREGGKDAT